VGIFETMVIVTCREGIFVIESGAFLVWFLISISGAIL